MLAHPQNPLFSASDYNVSVNTSKCTYWLFSSRVLAALPVLVAVRRVWVEPCRFIGYGRVAAAAAAATTTAGKGTRTRCLAAVRPAGPRGPTGDSTAFYRLRAAAGGGGRQRWAVAGGGRQWRPQTVRWHTPDRRADAQMRRRRAEGLSRWAAGPLIGK